jgi:predicted esterase
MFKPTHTLLSALTLGLAFAGVACAIEPANNVTEGDPPPVDSTNPPSDPKKDAPFDSTSPPFESTTPPFDSTSPPAPTNPAAAPTSPPADPAPPPAVVRPVTPSAQPDPGPPPPSTCSVQKDGEGFFVRTSAKSDYVAYVPASYSPSTPMRVVVGMHGCGDNAANFATWGVNPWAGRSAQQHIGISVGGETGNNKCWNIGGDDDKVMAAVDDLAKCYWLDRSKIVVAGFSSGGELGYRVGLMKSSEFAGILIENSALYAAGSTPTNLLAGATWKIPIAHRAHTNDSVFALAKVKADWQTIRDASFPLLTSEVAGTHDGNSEDWMWLLQQSASWVRPASR